MQAWSHVESHFTTLVSQNAGQVKAKMASAFFGDFYIAGSE